VNSNDLLHCDGHILFNLDLLLGAVQLVDVSSKLPGLKYRQGLAHWIPTSRDMVGYTTFNDVPEKWQTQIRPQMFPPAPEDVGKFNLERW
jgi:tRNA (cytosine34-C5)-methyltransferase